MIEVRLTDRLRMIFTEVKTVVENRREISHPKLNEIVVDFDNLDESIINADHIFVHSVQHQASPEVKKTSARLI
jgi:hypothetical protein